MSHLHLHVHLTCVSFSDDLNYLRKSGISFNQSECDFHHRNVARVCVFTFYNVQNRHYTFTAAFTKAQYLMRIVSKLYLFTVRFVNGFDFYFSHDGGSGLRLYDGSDVKMVPAGPTVAHLEVFFSSDFSLFHHSGLI